MKLKDINSFSNNVLFEEYFNNLSHVDAIQFIHENYLRLQFECKDNVELVRDFLINELGFEYGGWDLEQDDFIHLVQLNINNIKQVHGSFTIHPSLKLVNIYRLILQSIDSIDLNTKEYKPISLKG